MPLRKTIDFHKYHGCGNDFVLIDARRSPALARRRDWPSLTVALCDRHTGIGADQVLLLLHRTAGTDTALRIYNADGTSAGMCGNGLRCVGRHLAPKRDGTGVVRVSVGRAIFHVVVHRRDGRFVCATVDLGIPRLRADEIPMRCGAEPLNLPMPRELGLLVRRAGYSARMTCVNVGNPHAVVFGSDRAAPPDEMARIALAGAAIEHHAMFPERTNVQFVRPTANGRLRVRTWERGAGITLACGSGACAALVAAVLNGKSRRVAHVDLLGGSVQVGWIKSGEVLLMGPAERVFGGRFEIPAPRGAASRRR